MSDIQHDDGEVKDNTPLTALLRRVVASFSAMLVGEKGVGGAASTRKEETDVAVLAVPQTAKHNKGGTDT